MQRYLFYIFLYLIPFTLQGQSNQYEWWGYIGGGSPAKPFWLHSNTRGKINPDTYLWGNAGLQKGFTKTARQSFDYAFGIEGNASLGTEKHRAFIAQLYGKIKWQNLTINVGLWDRPDLYNNLSASNGNILYANNTRNLPGISFESWEYIKFPWILGRWISFKFRYAEYIMHDKRYVDNAHVHNKMLGGKITILPQFSIEGGIEDYAQWGGEAPEGKKEYSFKDYVKMVLIKEGGSEASTSDQINKLGNHIGMHFLKINYNNRKLNASIYYNHLFEDGSGMRFQNWPDGLYGLYVNRKNSDKWFKSFVYELYYTKSQSGPFHDRPATEEEQAAKDPSDPFQDKIILGGNDNYFNHGEYRSGWSLFGEIIGVPFFTPTAPNNGIITGTFNNRFIAHHWGICGNFPKINLQYAVKCSYSLNYGTHSYPLRNEQGENDVKSQFSLGLQLMAPENKLPFNTILNIGFDKGELLDNRFGIMLSISKTGIF